MSLPAPRPKQQKILEYPGGRMGVSAVPGSGKTWTLSLLAANILLRGGLEEEQEVLVVTLVNSAVENFYKRMDQFLRDAGYGHGGLFPRWGYRVRTLHALAHDIVRQRPGLVGLDDRFQIVDESETNDIRAAAVQAWMHAHPGALDEYINPTLDEGKKEWASRDPLREVLNQVAVAFIRTAKDHQWTPELVGARLGDLRLPLPLAEMGHAVYADYQRSLAYRGAVDFDDLIRLALQALQDDPALLEQLRYRWPYILEDEAQDSSRLQQEILSLLSGPHGNWVRVGDPNQAIYETFTTASPHYLQEFIAGIGPQRSRDLPTSGRSTPSIIRLANQLVRWTQSEHPVEEARDALHGPPFIETVPEGEEGANPPDNPAQVRLMANKYTPEDEVTAIGSSLARWLPAHPTSTVAVLVPRHKRGEAILDELKKRKLPVVEDLLRSSHSTRTTAGSLAYLLTSLAEPFSVPKLAAAFKVWNKHAGEGADDAHQKRCLALIRDCPLIEDYLYPEPGRDWLEASGLAQEEPAVYADLAAFRNAVSRWQAGVLLPVDQLVLTLAADLFDAPHELALSHKLAAVLRRSADTNPAWRLPELIQELTSIAKNERRFTGFSEEDSGFDPDRYPGQVVVTTVHRAKGLEWDRVYLMSVSNYDFPSGMVYDQYISEKWFIRGKLNLEAEALEQLKYLFSNDPYDWYREGLATARARLDYIRERLRLLYVGITRAKRELVVTWNTGRRGESLAAIPLTALQGWWEQQKP